MKKRFILLVLLLLITVGCAKKTNNVKNENSNENTNINSSVEENKEDKINVVDLDSKSRPYAVVINNYPKATKVQTGLNDAYLIYELPIEGGMTRSLALYKDKKDVKIGTIRSARHNYLDYVWENDAILVHFGWSAKAKKEIKEYKINHIDGSTSDPTPFKRENPEKLASEHTVYTTLEKIDNYNTKTKKYRNTTDTKVPLNYSLEEVELPNLKEAQVAKEVTITYSKSYKVKFDYDVDKKVYNRYINDKAHKDYFEKEQFTAKNIIVTLIDWGTVKEYTDTAGNNYLDLYNTGKGKGYYITNGYAKEITWEKKTRKDKTVYKYKDGTEIEVNDGNTYIMFQSKKKDITIK